MYSMSATVCCSPKQQQHTSAQTGVSLQGIEHMLVNLPFTMTPLSSPPQLQYPDGFIAHLDSAVQQYIQTRSLQPLRLLLTGPPAVGKSSLAAR